MQTAWNNGRYYDAATTYPLYSGFDMMGNPSLNYLGAQNPLTTGGQSPNQYSQSPLTAQYPNYLTPASTVKAESEVSNCFPLKNPFL